MKSNQVYPSPMSMVTQGLVSIGSTFLNMARSPATPDIHKQEFEQAAQNMHALSEAVRDAMHMETLLGDGPVSSSMRAFKTFGFIDPSNRNLDNLAVITAPVSIEEQRELGPGLDYRLLDSMLTHRYPKDIFDDNGEYKVPVFAYGSSLTSGVMVTLSLIKADIRVVADYCHLEKIVLEYTTVEEFWVVKQEYRRNSIYRQQEGSIDINHRVEGVWLNCKAQRFGNLVALVALTLPKHLERKVGFEFKDYRLGTFDRRDLEVLLDITAADNKEYRDALYDAVFTKLKRRPGKDAAEWEVLETPSGVQYRAISGHYNKTTWAEVCEELKTSYWARDKPIFGLDYIVIAGVKLTEGMPIPDFHRSAILEHWNSLIHEVIAETPVPVTDAEASDNPIEPI